MGRAASPPTWACYEQIHNDSDSDCSESNSDSCSEEDENFHNQGIPESPPSAHRQSMTDSDDNEQTIAVPKTHQDIDMDMDVDTSDEKMSGSAVERQKVVKGKQRAIEPEPVPKRQKKKRNSVYTLRPILTIQRSQGFVWNQASSILELFVYASNISCHSRISLCHPTSKIDVCLYFSV